MQRRVIGGYTFGYDYWSRDNKPEIGLDMGKHVLYDIDQYLTELVVCEYEGDEFIPA